MGGFFAAAAKFFVAVFVGAGAGASAAYVFAVNVARLGLLALTAKLAAPKLDFTDKARNKALTLRDTIAPQNFIYGEDMVSGPVIFGNVAGTDNRDLYYMVAIAGHEVDSVQAYRIDDIDIDLADLSGSEDGTVNAGKFNGVMEIEFLHGESTQAASTLLNTAFGSLWTANHTARGWATMVFKMTIDETNDTAYENGVPRNFRVLVRGRQVYDPRLDTSPGANPTNPSYIAWSENPALALADYIMDDKFGMREDASRIDWDMVVTAANVCDQTVSVPAPVNSQKRYTINGTFSANESRRDVRDSLVNAMMGRMVFSQGLWKMWAGDTVSADVTLTEANLAGSIQLQASASSKDRYNRVRGKFVDKERKYTASAYPEVRNSAYVTEDGGEVRELVADFTTVQQEYEAQRNAIIMLRKSRNQRVLIFEGNWSCFRIQPGATVSLDIDELGFAGEKFFVTEWKFGPNGISLTMVEESDSDWNDPLVGDYTTRSRTGTLNFADQAVQAPTLVSVTAVYGGALISWTNPAQATFSHIEIWVANENVRGSALLVGTSQGTTFYDNVSSPERERYYWIRAVNVDGKVSDWDPDLTTTTFTAFPLIQPRPIVPDPYIRQGSSLWDLVQGASYSVGTGTDGTDTVRLSPGVSDFAAAEFVKRRGPNEWDALAYNGMVIEVRHRVQMLTQPGGSYSGHGIKFRAIVTDEGSPENRTTYLGKGGHGFDNTSSAGVWYDAVDTIYIDQEENETPPRFITIQAFAGKNIGGTLALDFVEASVVGPLFAPNLSTDEGRPVGLVPDPTDYDNPQKDGILSADGKWKAAPGGKLTSRFTFDTTTTSGDPGSGEVRFNNATLASVTNIYVSATTESDIDMDNVFGMLVAGNRIYWQNGTGFSDVAVFQVSGAPTDNTGWWTIPVTVVDSNGSVPGGAVAEQMFAIDWNVDTSGGSGPAGTTAGAIQTWDTSVSPDAWTEETTVRVVSGQLRIYDGLGTDYLGVSHDGTDVNIVGVGTTDINITGISGFNVGNYNFDVDQTVGAGQDNYVLTYNNSNGLISLEAATGGSLPTGTVNDSVLRWNGSAWTEETRVRASGAGELSVFNTGGTDDGSWDHDGTDLNLRLTNTAAYNIIGAPLRINNSTGADWVEVEHDGSNGYIRTGGAGGGDLRLEPAGGDVQLRGGADLVIYNGGNTDSIEISHDGTDCNFTFTGTTDLNMTGLTAMNLASGTVIEWNNGASGSIAELHADDMLYRMTGTTRQFRVASDTDGAQFMVGTVGDPDKYFLVSQSSITWLTYTIWNSGNDGDGSGLDADTLGGIPNANVMTFAGAQVPDFTDIGDTDFVSLANDDYAVYDGAQWQNVNIPIVTQAQAEAGIDTARKIWTAQRVKQAIDALAPGASFTEVSDDLTPQLGGQLDVNGQSIHWADNEEAIFGTGNDFRIDYNGTNAVLNAIAGEIILQRNGTNTFRTEDHDGTGNSSGAKVLDHGGTLRSVGFNVLPLFNDDVSDTLEARHVGSMNVKDTTTARTLTLEASTGSDFEQYGMVTIMNLGSSGNYSVNEGTGVTLYVNDPGSGLTDTTGGLTIGPGGTCNIWRRNSTTYIAWGTELSWT